MTLYRWEDNEIIYENRDGHGFVVTLEDGVLFNTGRNIVQYKLTENKEVKLVGTDRDAYIERIWPLPDGRLAMALNAKLYFLDLKNGRSHQPFFSGEREIGKVVNLPSGAIGILGDAYERSARIVSAKGLEPHGLGDGQIKEHDTPNGKISESVLIADRYVVLVVDDTQVDVWDSETGHRINNIFDRQHTGQIRGVTPLEDGKFFAWDYDGGCSIWQIKGSYLKLIKSFRIAKRITRCVHICHSRCAVFHDYEFASLIDLDSGAFGNYIKFKNGSRPWSAWSLGDGKVFIVSMEGQMLGFDVIRSIFEHEIIDVSANSDIQKMFMTNNGHIGVNAKYDFYFLESDGKVIKSPLENDDYHSYCVVEDISDDLVAGWLGAPERGTIWHRVSGTKVATFKLDDPEFSTLLPIDAKKFLLWDSRNGTAEFISIKTGRILRSLTKKELATNFPDAHQKLKKNVKNINEKAFFDFQAEPEGAGIYFSLGNNEFTVLPTLGNVYPVLARGDGRLAAIIGNTYIGFYDPYRGPHRLSFSE